MDRPIRTLLFSTLYPSSVRPSHGIFVETRLRHLLASGQVETRVVAPVPWFPSTHPYFGSYAQFAATPQREIWNHIEVFHPRYFLPPKVGMNIAPVLLAMGAYRTILSLLRQGFAFDLIDAHYFYPDGVAAMILGRVLGKPVVITARGTDISLVPRYALPRWMIQRAGRRCAAIITVCKALKDELVDIGINPGKVTVLRNGVDLKQFYPEDRQWARSVFGMSHFALASVGHLVPRKGHDLVIGVLPHLTDAELFIAGSGPEERRLRALANSLDVADRVHFLGMLTQDQLRLLYSGADALVLASSREGWANVLLESMACGTPVIATNVWGTPEVVAAPEAGVLVEERSTDTLRFGIQRLRSALPDPLATRRYAEAFDWEATTKGQLDIFRYLLKK
jgi:teichuronic acid biosynthesis glycosyltransferase TuaC